MTEQQYFTGDIEIDNELMIEHLNNSTLYTGTNRKMMLKNGRGKLPTKDQISATWGLTRRGQLCPSNQFRIRSPYFGWYYTKTYSDNPQLKEIFEQYSDLHLPSNFFWTQCQINRNFHTPPHKDGENQNSSIIVGLGDYQGGKLAINKNGKVFFKGIKNIPTKFNGAKYTHWTTPFSGERWSLVFFTHHKKSELKKLEKKETERLKEEEVEKNYKDKSKKVLEIINKQIEEFTQEDLQNT